MCHDVFHISMLGLKCLKFEDFLDIFTPEGGGGTKVGKWQVCPAQS